MEPDELELDLIDRITSLSGFSISNPDIQLFTLEQVSLLTNSERLELSRMLQRGDIPRLEDLRDGTQVLLNGIVFTWSVGNNGFSMSGVSTRPTINKSSILKLAKTRHLSKSERDATHKPDSDWSNTSRGDVCRNACTIEVRDIVDKYVK